MRREQNGKYVVSSTSGEDVRAFVPAELPPRPPIDWSQKLRAGHERAIAAVGRLDGVATILPAQDVFIYSYVRKEALLSSQIEGTQSTLTDLFAFEADSGSSEDPSDVVEVSNYVEAMNHAIQQLKRGMPICNRVLTDAHGILLSRGRGQSSDPGNFRRSQNWIGGDRPGNARFVPPPYQEVPNCMATLERFINDAQLEPSALTRAALAHHQFETIHPFLDGNGRLGRLLISLILQDGKLLKEPLLYLSLYLKQNRERYYQLLDAVRFSGDWESWLEFFFEGVEQTATSAAATAQSLVKIFSEDDAKLLQQGRGTTSLMQIHRVIQRMPVFSSARLMKEAGLTAPTVNKSLERMQELGIVKESTGKKRNRLFGYDRYLRELEKGTEPIG